MLTFQWCDTCSSPEPGAVTSGLCNKKCGQKLVKQCIPLMREFGDQQQRLDELKQNLKEMQDKEMQFQEYRKAKENFMELQAKEAEILHKMDKFSKMEDGSI